MDNGIKYNKQGHNIEFLQDVVANKAVKSGYTVKSKPVTRVMNVKTGDFRGIVVKPVGGQKIKVRKNGNGKAEFVFYKKGGHGENKTINLRAELKKKRK